MDNRLILVSHGDLVELADARGTTLHVAKGRVGVTQDRDRRDIVLGTGETFTIETNGSTVVEAQGDTTLLLFGREPARVMTRKRKRGWEQWIATWFERSAERHLSQGWHM